MSNISLSTGLPDIVSVQKRVYPLLLTSIVSTQPTRLPVATAYGLKKEQEPDDASGWTKFKFRMDRWFSPVQSNKLKTEITNEAISDMNALGVSDTMITDHLADQIADDINQDLLDKLNKISSVGSSIAITSTDKYNLGRILYAEIHSSVASLESKTGVTGTYVVCGGAVYGLLLGTGWVSKVQGTNFALTNSGLIVVNDKYSLTDYVIVGVKKQIGDLELSSLVFSPYDIEGDGGLSYNLKATDYQSLNPVFGVMARYAVTAAPLGDEAEQLGAKEIDWDNITANQKSDLSVYQAVTLTIA